MSRPLPETDARSRAAARTRAGGRFAARLGAEGRALRARWADAPARRDRSLRHFEALLALALCLATIASVIWFDADVARAARTLSPKTVRILQRITDLGLSGPWFAASALVAFGAVAAMGRADSARTQTALRLLALRAFFVFATLAVSGLASQVVKHLFGRARPSLLDQFGAHHFDLFSWQAKLASMPSGHTITAFALAVALGFFLPRWRWVLLIVATAVGLSRIGVGAHYPADVLAGAAIGVTSSVYLRRLFAARRLAFEFRDGTVVTRGAGLIARALPTLWRGASTRSA